MNEVISIDLELEERLREEFGETLTPEFLNMLRLGKAVYEHAFLDFIPKEKLLEWVSQMYDGGKEQRAIYDCEIEGMVVHNGTDVISAGDYLEKRGKEEGYLSE